MSAYYNEFEPAKAAWLAELIAEGVIADGKIDTRTIHDVQPADLVGFERVHLCAGIGVWDYALDCAGWNLGPVWTASLPCQPFSTAGRRESLADARHIWPEAFRLIRESRPAIILGEQVSSKDGLAWFDVVAADLEDAGYAVAAVDTCAASAGAPHIRQRLYWLAHLMLSGRTEGRTEPGHRQAAGGGEHERLARQHGGGQPLLRARSAECGSDGGMANGEAIGQDRWRPVETDGEAQQPQRCGNAVWLEHGEREGLEGQRRNGDGGHKPRRQQTDKDGPAPASGEPYRRLEHAAGEQERLSRRARLAGAADRHEGYHDLAWLDCRDGNLRPTARLSESGLLPLVDGASSSLGYMRLEGEGAQAAILAPLIEKGTRRILRLKGYGDAIVAPLATEFIRAAMEALEERL
ncbi:MAG: DNA cytosine methyltransferase [Patescibacteria group bacterium]|nr:DNA cytosine methyltransferase [Patescibacteria group bacterium]